jgi:hypothetical protein
MMTRLETTLETRLEKSKDTKGRTAKKNTKLFGVASFAAKINQNLQLNNGSFQDFTIKVTNHNEHNCCLFHKEKSERGCCERERERERKEKSMPSFPLFPLRFSPSPFPFPQLPYRLENPHILPIT